MEGPTPELNISTVLHLIADAHHGKPILVVINQFEDIIPYLNTPRCKHLLDAFATTHNAPVSNLHIMICYRGDAEPKVGTFWQQISGSASGLPRYYLGPLSGSGATTAIAAVIQAESPAIAADELQTLAERIIHDVAAESSASLGVTLYPPFLQMVAAGLAKADSRPSLELYVKLGAARRLIGG